MKTPERSARRSSDYFEEPGHEVAERPSLVPPNDPTLMFANAGMVQFKDVFTGRDSAATSARPPRRSASASAASTTTSRTSASPRATTRSSRCSATSRSATTSRRTRSRFAWELLTKTSRRPDRSGWSSPSSAARRASRPTTRRARSGRRSPASATSASSASARSDNFWQMGDTGPVRAVLRDPLLLRRRQARPRALRRGARRPTARGWVEIWNLVFMQFERARDGRRRSCRCRRRRSTPARASSASPRVVQGVRSQLRHRSAARRIVERAARARAASRYGGDAEPDDVSMRVIADHARTHGVPDRRGRVARSRRARVRAAPRHAPRDPPRASARASSEPFLHEVRAARSSS